MSPDTIEDLRRRGVVVIDARDLPGHLVDLAPLQRDPLPPFSPAAIQAMMGNLRGESRVERYTPPAAPLLPRGAKRLHGKPKQITSLSGRTRYRKRVRVDGRKLARVTR